MATAAKGASRDRAVRAIVFSARLFEYECRQLGVSMAQYRMLLYLRHGPRRAGELAQQAAITRPSLSTLIAALEQMGLVQRSGVDADRRGVRLELTRKGLSEIGRVEKRFGEVFDDASVDCDRPRLVAALEELAAVLGDQIEARVRPEE
ncbi:MAG: MarR family transcriptional regulator [Myxococcales bacterium]|nr:MarR family transcriptional regulator [Myxococcales bacterium]